MVISSLVNCGSAASSTLACGGVVFLAASATTTTSRQRRFLFLSSFFSFSPCFLGSAFLLFVIQWSSLI